MNILKYLKNNLKITFKEFVADFIRDEDGIWWFINVKAFILDEYVSPINNKKITMNMNPEPEPEVVEDTNPTISYQKLRACKFCNIVYPMTEL